MSNTLPAGERERSKKGLGDTYKVPVLRLLIKQLTRLAHGHANEPVLAGAAAHATAAHSRAAAGGVAGLTALGSAQMLVRIDE